MVSPLAATCTEIRRRAGPALSLSCLVSAMKKLLFFAVNAYKFTETTAASPVTTAAIAFSRKAAASTWMPERRKRKTPIFCSPRSRKDLKRVRRACEFRCKWRRAATPMTTIHWPKDRPIVEFGTIELRSVIADNAAQQRHIIFDPIPRVEGIESSAILCSSRAPPYISWPAGGEGQRVISKHPPRHHFRNEALATST